MSQKNDAVTISPQKDYGLGMHSKNISWCQTEKLDDSDSAQRNLENFSDDSNSPPLNIIKETNCSKKSPTPKNKNPKAI